MGFVDFSLICWCNFIPDPKDTKEVFDIQKITNDFVSMFLFFSQLSTNPSCFAKCNSHPSCVGFVALERNIFEHRNCSLIVNRTLVWHEKCTILCLPVLLMTVIYHINTKAQSIPHIFTLHFCNPLRLQNDFIITFHNVMWDLISQSCTISTVV